MPRRPRLIIPGIPLHIIQRGNNRQNCFYSEKDYRCYLEWLKEYSREEGCQVHAYVLMTNHVHLLASSSEASGIGNMMKRLGQRYVQYFNRTSGRSGTLWEGRFRSCLVQGDAYLLQCQRYIELNPVRAGIVKHPVDYPWSSYGTNAQGELNDLIHPHSLYQKLGDTPTERFASYRALFDSRLEQGVIEQIRSATNGNYALGNDRFAEDVEKLLGRRATRGIPGRPARKR